MLFGLGQWNDSSTAGARGGIWLVLHLRPKKRGSMEQQLIALGERLGARGVPVTMVFSEAPRPWMQQAFAERRISWRTLNFAPTHRAALELLAMLRLARPQLVHFHFLRATSPLVAAARLAGARVVVHDHVTLTRATASRTYEGLKTLRDAVWMPLVDLRVAVSKPVAESVADIEHVDPSRIAVVENGIDLGRFENASGAGVKQSLGCAGRPLVVCVSRLQHEKGVETAIRAVPHLGRSTVLAMVGDGPIEAHCRALAEELGVANRVRFLGLRDDVEQLVAAADVVLAPSHWEEAFGLAVVEGMAAGKPVVVSRSGAMPDLVGDTGVVVPKRDPEALARAVGELLDDPLRCARMGKAARARAQRRFSMAHWVDAMTAVYERVLPSLSAGKAAA
jgi:glycosyltransferase involved in cell wall biosynthesis